MDIQGSIIELTLKRIIDNPSEKSLARKAGELRGNIETAKKVTSPLNALNKAVIDQVVQEFVVAPPAALLSKITGTEVQHDHFSITDYSRGIVDAILSVKDIIGLDLAVLMNELVENKSEMKDLITNEMFKLYDDPEAVLDKKTTTAGFLLEDAVDYMEASEYEDLSYVTGRVAGMIILSRMLGSGGMLLKTLGTGRKLLKGSKLMFPEQIGMTSIAKTEIITSFIGKTAETLAPKELNETYKKSPHSKEVDKILGYILHKMDQEQSPLKLKKYSSLSWSLYRNSKDPENFPIPKEDINFMRELTIEAYTHFLKGREIKPETAWKFVDAAVLLLDGHLPDEFKGISPSKIKDLVPTLPLNQIDQNGLVSALQAIENEINGGKVPSGESLDALFRVINRIRFRQPSKKPKFIS